MSLTVEAPVQGPGGAIVNETFVTLVGNVATDIRSAQSRDGVPITSFRVASTTRRQDRGRGWADVDTLFVTVVCWRQLAEHAATSFAKGDPVIVTGRIRVRQWTSQDGRSGTAVELEAQAAGHDLARGTSSFTRARAHVAERAGRREADNLAELVSSEPLDDAREPAEPTLPAGTDPSAAEARHESPEVVTPTIRAPRARRPTVGSAA
jgi:single-strand DNA-binding protein